MQNAKPQQVGSARPYIWRLRNLSRSICPSACPLLQGEANAAPPADKSAQARREAARLGRIAVVRPIAPAINAAEIQPVNHAEEMARQAAGNGDRWFHTAQRVDESLVVTALTLGGWRLCQPTSHA